MLASSHVAHSAPTITTTSTTIPSNGILGIGDTMEIRVTYSEVVTVVGSPSVVFEFGSETRSFTYDPQGSVNNFVRFIYTVKAGDDYVGSIGASSIELNGGAIYGDNGNASLYLQGRARTNIVIDTTSPVVQSIKAAPGTSRSAATVVFDVVFSEAVTGVTPASFTLTRNGGADYQAISSSNGSGTTYTVTVTGVSGYGTLRLDLKSGNNVVDQAGNSAQGFTAGTAHGVGLLSPTLTLSISPASPVVGQAVTLTATLTGGDHPTGMITLKDGGTPIMTETVVNNVAVFNTTMNAVVSQALTAEYSGDANHDDALSNVVSLTVEKATPSFNVTIDNPNPQFGGLVIVETTLNNAVSPTGNIIIEVNGSLISLDSSQGVVTQSYSNLPVGMHDVHISFEGDAKNKAIPRTFGGTITVRAPALSILPLSGGLPDAISGNDYSQALSTTGAVGAVRYSIVSGRLPTGLMLNASTGEISGKVDPNSQVGPYSFTARATDSTNATADTSLTLEVKLPSISAPNVNINVANGSAPNNVNLETGATGGPFIDATIVSVVPAHAGTATIVRGEFAQASGPVTLGWYLKFVPRPSFTGSAVVSYTLSSALATSSAATITYSLIGYNAAQEAAKVNSLVEGFVETRQSMISESIKVPGLIERRRASHSRQAVDARLSPSEYGVNARFSTSLLQLQSSRDAGDGVSDAAVMPYNFWIDGSISLHNRNDNGEEWGAFSLLNLGADYLVSESVLLGLSLHYDVMRDPTKQDAELTGKGWLAGPYASIELGSGVFWDSSILYGGSYNDIDTLDWDGSFNTSRWLMDTSIKGEWRLQDATVLTPSLRALYFNEQVKTYTVSNFAGDELTIDGFNAEQFRVSLGAEIMHSFALDDGARLTPKLGVGAGYAALSGSGAFGSVSAGLSLETAGLWMLDASILYNIEGDGQQRLGARVKAAKDF